MDELAAVVEERSSRGGASLRVESERTAGRREEEATLVIELRVRGRDGGVIDEDVEVDERRLRREEGEEGRRSSS
jgi:hypothetical protein